ncbi:MAG TPA: VWA domain-containing protein [Pyrinomonadaceae bacterium]
MNLPVASLFLLSSVTLLAPIAHGQTTHRRVSKSTLIKPRGATVKICQGLPIPAGYIITAYMTTSACPHGAYVLKRLDTGSESSIPEKRAPTESERSVATRKQNTESESLVPANKKPVRASGRSGAVNSGAQMPAATAPSGSRPRRAGVVQTDSDVPYLHGIDTTAQANPPTLTGMTIGTPVSAASNAIAAPGPEEVAEGDVVRVDTALVTVPVSVLDHQGHFVANLRREDFSVFENGIEQSVAFFEPAEKPFTVALILDTSASTHFHLWEIKEAAIAFARQLRPQDRVLVVSFNDQVLLLTEATNDLNVVSTVIIENATAGDSTRLYDAVDLVIKERLNKIKGRKAIVLFTDGVDTSSYLATYQSTLREVEELDALIYPIQYDTSDYLRAIQNAGRITIVSTSSNWPFPGRSSSQVIYGGPATGGIPPPGTTKADYERADKYLNELAEKTGAHLYQANDPAQLAQAFSRIAEELRRQYSLGYYPGVSAVKNGERRQIKVRVHQPNLAVRARDSYVRSSSAGPVQ